MSCAALSHKTNGYCWRTPKCRKLASHMPSLKAQERGESEAATVVGSRGKRFANSIPMFLKTDKPSFQIPPTPLHLSL
jgi:hypothetical protein